MTFQLVLDGVRYQDLVLEGLVLEGVVNDWLGRIAPAAQAAHGMVSNKGLAHVSRLRWIGERYDVELIHSGACPAEVSRDDILFWWTPPEPPPAELMRYAEQATQ